METDFPEHFTTKEAMTYLGIKKTAFYEYIKKYGLKKFRTSGNKKLWLKSQIYNIKIPKEETSGISESGS
jgi:predicted DNA-binding transcriptional regulator AlpA